MFPASSRARSGSALVLVMAFVVIGVMTITVSTNLTQARYESISSSHDQNTTVGALESVLTRREAAIVRLAEVGDPAEFHRLHANYGEELFAGCRVRWKIEPAIIREAQAQGDIDGDGMVDNHRFITNPPADVGIISDIPVDLQNDFIYIYRIAGEARYLPGGEAWDGDYMSRVQAVRYVALAKQPVFRYVIFYAQEGPKGDLEFSHVPALSVGGNVQCNGSIYVGSGSVVNDWSSLNPSSEPTALGPDENGDDIRVNGAYGIFRLSKHSLYSAFDPAIRAQTSGTSLSGIDSGYLPNSASYDTDPDGVYTGETGAVPAYPLPPAGVGDDVFAATFGGTIINPNRVADDLLATTGGVRTINTDNLLGVDLDPSNPANDSRVSGWKGTAMQAAPIGFNGFARTSANGGSVLRLPDQMGSRAFAVQRLVYDDLDGNPVTDEHEYARPLFVDTAGNETTAIPQVGPIVEAMGTYAGYAMGAEAGYDFFFKRRSATDYPSTWYDDNSDPRFNGWDVISNPANNTLALQSGHDNYTSGAFGLIVRERPRPDRSYLAVASPTGVDDFWYLPFAYGKHTRETRWPFWAMDVVALRGKNDAGLSGNWMIDEWRHWDKAVERNNYADGGTVRISAAMDPGPDDADGDYHTNHDGWWDKESGLRRYPMYYRNNYRFFNLQRPALDEDARGTGLVGTYYNGRDFAEVPKLHRIDATVDFNWSTGNPGGGIANDSFSAVWMGFVTAPEDGAFTFSGYTDDGVRIWVADQLVVDHWRDGAPAYHTTTDILLEQGEDYPIVMEYYEKSGGAAARLSWRRPSMAAGAWEVVPTAQLSPHQGAMFNRDDIVAVQMKVDALDGAAQSKVGLMLRGEEQVYASGGPGTAGGAGGVFSTSQVAYWDMDEASGSLAPDDTGNNHNGTLKNGAVFDPTGGRDADAGGAVQFFDQNDVVQVASSAMINTGIVTQRTVSLWFRCDDVSLTSRKQVLFEEGGGTRGMNLYIYGGELFYGGWNIPSNESNWAGTWLRTSAIADDTWHHVMLTIEGNDTVTSGAMKCYLDGVLVANGDASKLWPHGDATGIGNVYGGTKFHSGSSSSNSGFVGHIDEVRIYDTAYDLAFAQGLAGTAVVTVDMPDEHLSPIQDGRAPYLNLAYAKDRGIIVEYRPQRASSETVRQYTWFTGTKSALPTGAEVASGETATDPGLLTRTVTVKPRDVSPSDPLSVSKKEQVKAKYSQTGSPTKTSKSLGDGWTLYWYMGTIKRKKCLRAERWVRNRVTERWRFDLQGRDNSTTQIFDSDGDRNNAIKFFKDTSGSTTVWSTTLSGGWYVRDTYVQRTWTANSSKTNYNPSNWWDPSHTKEVTYPTTLPSGGANYVAWNFGSYKAYKQKGGSKVTLNSSQLQAELKNFSTKYQVYGDPSYPEPATPPYPVWPTPSVPTVSGGWVDKCAAAGVTTTSERTFSVDRARDIRSDLNSFVSRSGYDHDPAVRQFKPWPSWATEDPPVTSSFRPDQWHGSSAPTSAGATMVPASLVPVAGDKRPFGSWADDISVHPGADDGVWLRFERVGTDELRLLYYVGDLSDPTPADFTAVRNHAGGELRIDLANFAAKVQLGFGLQSGDQDAVAEAVLQDISVEFDPAGSTTTTADPPHILNSDDWENVDVLGATFTTRYLASQYQVFWGPFDITEAFFSYTDPNGDRIGTEEWIYNTREFYSQSRWWEDGVEKDAAEVLPTGSGSMRELLSKQTLFSINMAALQNFLITNTLQDALANSIDGGYGDHPTLASAPLLRDRFNGIIYVARTNRYPWNPNLDAANAGGANPWTWPEPMPNSSAGMGYSTHAQLMAMDPTARAARYRYMVTGQSATGASITASLNARNNSHLDGSASGDVSTYGDLQPYDVVRAPAFKPQHFHHGVRIVNSEAVDWGLGVSQSGATPAGTPEFGDSKTIFVTPNQLFLQGDVNTATYTAKVNGNDVAGKFTPFAVVGDMVTLLSNSWDDADWQEPGIVASLLGVTDGGSLYRPFADPISDADRYVTGASSTTYNTSIVTHNQPTSRESVRNGEAATIISVMQYLEDWTNQDMNFRGSLVVMDSRRFTESYLLDIIKEYGITPFGTMGWHRGQSYHEDGLRADSGSSALHWNGSISPIYAAPNRNFDFNPDLLTEPGTPPFTPFGVTSTGTGAWVKVLK